MSKRSFSGSNLQGIDDTYTLSDDLADQAISVGVDGWNFFGEDREWAMGVWGGVSSVSGSREYITDLQQNSSHYFQRPDADHLELDTNLTVLNGFAGRIILNKEQGNLQFNTALGVISPGFESNDLGRTSITDCINHHAVIGYRWNDPGKIFQSARMDFALQTNHNFAGQKNGEQRIALGDANFTNYWSIHWFYDWMPEVLSNNDLRGGPAVLRPTVHMLDIGLSTDSRKDIEFDVYTSLSTGPGDGHSEFYHLSVDLNLGDQLNISFGPSISNDLSMAQYIESVEDASAIAMGGNRYIVGQLEQHTVSANIRVGYTFTPQLSLQAYFQPFVSVGKYTHFKEYAAPETYSFINYDASPIRVDEDGDEVLDLSRDPDAEDITIGNPDFNSKSMVGTAVLRWEFSPGSTAYLVWTRSGSNDDRPGVYDFNRDMRDVLSAQADDFIALKITYWLGH